MYRIKKTSSVTFFLAHPVYELVMRGVVVRLAYASFELGAGYLYVPKNLLRLAATPLPQGYNSSKRPKYLDERTSDVPCVRACVGGGLNTPTPSQSLRIGSDIRPEFLFLSNVMMSLFSWILCLPALLPLYKLVID